MNHELLANVHGAIRSYCYAEHNGKDVAGVRLHEPTFSTDEINAAVDVLLSRNVTAGEKVREFEKAFGPNAVMCNSGSSANLLAIAALCDPANPNRLERGDRVIVSALSWSTTVWPLVQYGLRPVIVDIDPETLNIDPNEIERAGDARAIMPVHVYGNSCDMTAIMDIAHRKNMLVIEDCCEALGAKFEDERVGSFGDIATFSFYFSHHITTVEGGMITTPDRGLADGMRIARAHGWLRDVEGHVPAGPPDIDPRFLFVRAGYNLRPTEMSAAMGLVQLPKLAGYVDRRREAAERLLAIFAPYENWFTCQKETGRSSWFGFPITVSDDAPFTVKEIRKFFETSGIETRPIICGNIARQPGMKYYPHSVIGDLKHANRVMRNGFSLPCHQDVDEGAAGYIARALEKFVCLKR